MCQQVLYKILWLWLMGCIGLSSMEIDTEYCHNTFGDVYDQFVPIPPLASTTQAQQHLCEQIGQKPTLEAQRLSAFKPRERVAQICDAIPCNTPLFLLFQNIRI